MKERKVKNKLSKDLISLGWLNVLGLLLLLMLLFVLQCRVFMVDNGGKVGYLVFGEVDLKVGWWIEGWMW